MEQAKTYSILNRSNLEVLESGVAKDMGCYAYNNILLDVKNNRTVSTDGRVLFCVDLPESPKGDEITNDMIPPEAEHHDDDVQVLIPLPASKKILKNLDMSKGTYGSLDGVFTLGKNCKSWKARLTDLETTTCVDFRPAEGDFPKYDEVLPEKGKGDTTMTLGVPILEALIKAAKKAGSNAIRMEFDKGDDQVLSAIRIDLEYIKADKRVTAQGQEVYGAIMPISSSS